MQGDELDALIRKGEKEIRALENTLFLMNGRNHEYRESVLHADDDGQLSTEKDQLDGQVGLPAVTVSCIPSSLSHPMSINSPFLPCVSGCSITLH